MLWGLVGRVTECTVPGVRTFTIPDLGDNDTGEPLSFLDPTRKRPGIRAPLSRLPGTACQSGCGPTVPASPLGHAPRARPSPPGGCLEAVCALGSSFSLISYKVTSGGTLGPWLGCPATATSTAPAGPASRAPGRGQSPAERSPIG